MKEHSVVRFQNPARFEDLLTELLQNGAQQLIQQAVESEVTELLALYSGRIDANGRRAVVRNGYLPERQVLTGIGPVAVRVPKVAINPLAPEDIERGESNAVNFPTLPSARHTTRESTLISK